MYMGSANAEGLNGDEWFGIGMFTALHAVDCLQTYSAAHQPELYEEGSFILGQKPTDEQIIGWCAVSEIFQIGLVTVLPRKYRAKVQWFSIGVKGMAVGVNISIGVEIW